ncbi:NUDIX hydrolase [Halosolutus gelatinilyticus]|uniref:NUDIX hydrolase n=1 Tax=Halosolutus gelatinilyticus TaxID=2931975 RepID=UPI001FF54B9E|nr:CoA pyrophosphatase [Halosolutus gelatinilyticus]
MPEQTLHFDPIAAHRPVEIDDQEHDAAVLAPVIERDGEHHLLFTRRADHLGEHPGQMSFPGGGAEPEDETILDTALREADEEIGLRASEAEIVGQLDDIRTITEYAVTPFVARIPDREYDRDEDEVAEIIALPLSGLLDPENYEYERRDHPYYGDIVIHYFHVDGYTVWGATGRILVQLLELATDFEAPEKVDRSTL